MPVVKYSDVFQYHRNHRVQSGMWQTWIFHDSFSQIEAQGGVVALIENRFVFISYNFL